MRAAFPVESGHAGHAARTQLAVTRLVLTHFAPMPAPSSSPTAARWCWPDRTARARPICSMRSRCSRPAAACAAPGSANISATGPPCPARHCGRVAATVTRGAEVYEIGTGLTLGPRRRRTPAGPAERRAGTELGRSGRDRPDGVADAGHGPALHRRRERPAQIPRPARARLRSRPCARAPPATNRPCASARAC